MFDFILTFESLIRSFFREKKKQTHFLVLVLLYCTNFFIFFILFKMYFSFLSVISQTVHSNIVSAAAQPNQLPMHPPQQPTPQPPTISGQHVTQGPVVMTGMAYFVQQQQAFTAPPHAQQAIGKEKMVTTSKYCRKISCEKISINLCIKGPFICLIQWKKCQKKFKRFF